MKTLSRWWVVALIATAFSYYMLNAAMDEFRAFAEAQSGWRGFMTGFMHGLVFDFDLIRRVDVQQRQLLLPVIYWQNIFRGCLLASILTGTLKLYYTFWDKRRGSALVVQ